MLNVCSLYQPYIKVLHGVYDNSWKCRFTLNYMSLVSLLTRFSLFRAQWMCLAEKKWAETRQTHYSAFCVAPGNWLMLIFTMYLHSSRSVAKLIFFHEIPSTSNVILSQTMIFLAFTCLYDLFCRQVTHVSIEIWFSSILIFVYIHLYDI